MSRPPPGPRADPRRLMGRRLMAIALIVIGALLIRPVDTLLDAVRVAAIVAILIAVGFGGALAAGADARRGSDPRSRPRHRCTRT